MFSYRHSFHAGNHADVFKHICQMLILDKLVIKSKPCVYIDTHSGAGIYDLTSDESSKTDEYRQGIKRLNQYQGDNKIVERYLSIVNQYLALEQYPGSPEIAQNILREFDQSILMEFHNSEIEILKSNMRNKHVSIHHRDGFEGLIAITPPQPARGLVLIDPPYERVEEYLHVAQCVTKVMKRWSNGIVAIWYPLLGNRSEQKIKACESMRKSLSEIDVKSTLDVQFCVNTSSEEEGMYGSGMYILNPPWQLDEQLEAVLPELCELLQLQQQGGYSVTWVRSE